MGRQFFKNVDFSVTFPLNVMPLTVMMLPVLVGMVLVVLFMS